MAIDPYQDLREQIESEGFHCPSTESMGKWSRIIACSQGPPRGYGGRSFWITKVDSGWYVGTWAPHAYRFPQPDRMLDFVREFLCDTETSVADVAPELARQYDLVELTDDEFDRLLPDDRPEY